MLSEEAASDDVSGKGHQLILNRQLEETQATPLNIDTHRRRDAHVLRFDSITQYWHRFGA